MYAFNMYVLSDSNAMMLARLSAPGSSTDYLPLEDIDYIIFFEIWWARQDLNPQPTRYERAALTS